MKDIKYFRVADKWKKRDPHSLLAGLKSEARSIDKLEKKETSLKSEEHWFNSRALNISARLCYWSSMTSFFSKYPQRDSSSEISFLFRSITNCNGMEGMEQVSLRFSFVQQEQLIITQQPRHTSTFWQYWRAMASSCSVVPLPLRSPPCLNQ